MDPKVSHGQICLVRLTHPPTHPPTLMNTVEFVSSVLVSVLGFSVSV